MIFDCNCIYYLEWKKHELYWEESHNQGGYVQYSLLCNLYLLCLKMADVHISSISKVSHQHCVIEWDQTKGAYVLELLSSNGVEVGPLPPSQTLEYHTPGTRITLPNPCQIIIQTVPLFFQCFYVAVEPEPEPEQPEPVAQYSVTSIASSRSKRSARSQGLTSSVFREMIEEALEDAGGKATQKEIIEYIDNWHPEVVQKKNWRHSVSGILSSNPTIFSTEPAMLPSGKRARYALWGLRRVTGETLEVVEETYQTIRKRKERT